MNMTPYWNDVGLPNHPKLTRDLHVDVVVIGGGITGISTAYLLTQAGARVALLERLTCMKMDTGHTTAHLSYVTDSSLTDLVATFGCDHGQAVWDAGRAALQQIEAQVNEESIACDFKWIPGFVHTSLVDGDQRKTGAELKEEAKLAVKLGFDAAFLERVPFIDRPGIRFANQAKFHPRKYLAGLLKAIDERGSHVFERTEVTEIKENNSMQVVTRHGAIHCENVVIATNVPLQGSTNVVSAMLFQFKLTPYTSYVLGARIPRGLVNEASFWDTTNPYYYLRIDRGKKYDYAIFGGEDHKTGQVSDTAERYQRLETTFRRIIPQAKIDHRWSGQVIETNDGLPFIGETAAHQFVATGFCGNGMTFATVAAMMARDAFTGRSNPWRELFSPERKTLKTAWSYLKENKDYPYYMLKDRLVGAEGTSPRDLKCGEGKILEIKGRKMAVSRAGNGRIVMRSAICPHMGCLVNWNEAERTWDCPCHGSRFKATGEVLAGPAEDDLSKLD